MSIPLSLDASLLKEKDMYLREESSLAPREILQLLSQQRGPFADITEEALLKEINPDPEDDEVAIEQESEAEEELSDQVTQDQFFVLKNEVVQLVNTALNESSLSLDFISLLLSSVRPAAGSVSMSPFLKSNVPMGSLNADRISPQAQTTDEQVSQLKTGQGWKLNRLQESSATLNSTAENLRHKLEQEQKYWKSLANNINKDVAFKTRDPTSKKVIGIKYGYSDSGSLYPDKGVAILKQKNGDLELDATRQEKYVRVRLFSKDDSLDDYVLTGESRAPVLSDELIKDKIVKLRFLLFEEELMYQMKRESDSLVSHGCYIENENKIVLEGMEKLEIEYVSMDDEVEIAERVNDARADAVLTMLRMLLVVMFKKQEQLTLKQPILTKKSAPQADVLILRPVMDHLKHVATAVRVFDMIKSIIPDATFSDFVTKTTPREVVEEAEDSYLARIQHVLQTFTKITGKPETSFKVTKGTELEISIFSTAYGSSSVTIKGHSLGTAATFTELKDVEEFLHYVTQI